MPLLDRSVWNIYEVFSTCQNKRLFLWIVINVLHIDTPSSFPQTLASLPAPSVLKWASYLSLFSQGGLFDLPCFLYLKRPCCVMWKPVLCVCLPELNPCSGMPHQSPCSKVTELLEQFWHGIRGCQPIAGELQLENVSRSPASCHAGSQVCILSWT